MSNLSGFLPHNGAMHKLVIELSRQKNSQRLLIIKPHTGSKLPPDRYCLFACNYRQRGKRVGPRLQLGVQSMTPRLNISPQQGGATLRTVSQAVSKVSKLPGACLSLVTKTPTSPIITIVSRPSVTTSASPVSSSVAKLVTATTPVATLPPSKSSSMIASLVTRALKRKREEDEDYNNP
ncbi:PREDICTED: transcription initiation factor TFIID subunit 9B-like [Priapulus caudatus]|uniref:Transcription initiation factor TFIID subunit 9B-like n=1 Tax=Priapulus caudatus TaxID=37621 RepID=A0ABM1DTZ6_PRICU|nr:PREDICTED: transcription initiation factor TFIID subunit 9B-like [Priapulus caudatus]XP_014663415.1 PREDICTED: transcription initiation factor TFIID subunit 9B-like [Priapulus caudatus]XP_014663416.1 PREDICTED: transcription initiation factor TFIID subunit 9B-like [Priapulus caudatus]XP_014663417.1 PREDICTED: transcription initiation factor TFIID subunit 9B-like [Priapulus caudatus]XP_014663418.1 PREDICTED: transcription initiation factor TFIID subunit 9B-like [Priapulus caudatus]XP_0146634